MSYEDAVKSRDRQCVIGYGMFHWEFAPAELRFGVTAWLSDDPQNSGPTEANEVDFRPSALEFLPVWKLNSLAVLAQRSNTELNDEVRRSLMDPNQPPLSNMIRKLIASAKKKGFTKVELRGYSDSEEFNISSVRVINADERPGASPKS